MIRLRYQLTCPVVVDTFLVCTWKRDNKDYKKPFPFFQVVSFSYSEGKKREIKHKMYLILCWVYFRQVFYQQFLVFLECSKPQSELSGVCQFSEYVSRLSHYRKFYHTSLMIDVILTITQMHSNKWVCKKYITFWQLSGKDSNNLIIV